MSVENIYEIKSKDGFISSFSISNEVEKLRKQVRDFTEDICILINPSKVLSKKIEAWKSFRNAGESNMLNNIFEFIGEIKEASTDYDSKNHFSLYSFTNKVRKLDMSSINDLKYTLLSSFSQNCDIILSLSDLFNDLNAENYEKEGNKGRFLRIIIFSSQIDKSLSAKDIKDVISSFISSNKNYNSVVLNILMMEYDVDFVKETRAELDYLSLTDTKPIYFDESLQTSSKEINFLLSIYQNKKYYFEKLNEKIKNFITEGTSQGSLVQFVKDLDEKMLIVKEVYSAILKDWNIMLKPTTRSQQKDAIKGKINNEVISVGMIDRATRDSKGYITEKINGEIGEWLTAQKRNVRIIVDNIQEVRDDLGVLEIKDNEFWEKKLKFLEEQNEILGKILRRIENSLEFVEFVEHNMTDIVDKIMTVKY